MSQIGIRLGHGNGRTAVAPATNVGDDTAPHPLFSPFAAFLPWDLWLSMRCSPCAAAVAAGDQVSPVSALRPPVMLRIALGLADPPHTSATATTVPGLPINAQLPCSSNPDSPAAGSKTAGTVSSRRAQDRPGFPRRPGLNPWRLVGQGPLPPDPPTCFRQQNLPGCQQSSIA